MVSDSIPAGGDDLALASAAGRADSRAQRAVVDRLLDRVRATVHYLVAGNNGDADDLVQLSLVEILRSVDSFKGRSRLETWADRITVRTTMRELRRRRKQEKAIVRDSEEGLAALDRAPEVSLQQSQEREALRGQLRGRLAQKLQRLSPQRRAVVVLRYVHGYSILEISRLTDAPPNTVRDRLQVGKRLLRGFILKDPVMRDWAEMMDR